MCVISLITENLISAIHLQNIEINGVQTQNYAEGQRFICDTQGKSLYTEVCGPWPDTLNSDGTEKHIALHYVIECHVSGIDDRYPNDPITIQTKNAGADISKLIMSDHTRGGNALITRIDGEPYYYFTGDPTAPEFVIRIDAIVEVFMNITDPYQQ